MCLSLATMLEVGSDIISSSQTFSWSCSERVASQEGASSVTYIHFCDEIPLLDGNKTLSCFIAALPLLSVIIVGTAFILIYLTC